MTGDPFAALGAVKTIWDMLINLLQADSNNKKSFFENHVEPLQEKLTQVHKDYIKGFQEAQKYLRDGSVPPMTLLDFLKERRRDYQPERQLVESTAAEIISSENSKFSGEIKSFILDYSSAILEYFGITTNANNFSWYTHFITTVEHKVEMGAKSVWNPFGISGNPRLELLDSIDLMLDEELPEAFEKIAKAYARLKLYLV